MMMNLDLMPSIRAGKCLYHLWLPIFAPGIACWAYLNTIWCSHKLYTESCFWDVWKAGQRNVGCLTIVSFAAVLNNSSDRDARAQRCEVSLQPASRAAGGTAGRGPCELQQGRLHFAWDIHILSWWLMPVTRSKKTACTRRLLNLHLFRIISPSSHPREPTLQVVKRSTCRCTGPGFQLSTHGEGEVLILQKSLCKKAERGEKKKKKITRTGREYQGRHA